ncbi:hypothetical protein M8C21_010401 [Ambrosia artemisiifolia]|uniref:Uncharacterized protein n=1 Tax=Ambrosia artemisiifolia TaxID=4212 RepID=A0AAD5GHK4_AMBAR|nr:hypothetical protein M8C21_010401 [Ambrosia artemisiifolia]
MGNHTNMLGGFNKLWHLDCSLTLICTILEEDLKAFTQKLISGCDVFDLSTHENMRQRANMSKRTVGLEQGRSGSQEFTP